MKRSNKKFKLLTILGAGVLVGSIGLTYLLHSSPSTHVTKSSFKKSINQVKELKTNSVIQSAIINNADFLLNDNNAVQSRDYYVEPNHPVVSGRIGFLSYVNFRNIKGENEHYLAFYPYNSWGIQS